jgi:hypothetical protein
MSDLYSRSNSLDPNGTVQVTFEGRSLQIRPDQLTITVLSKVFRLIPETILLVSDVGTIATAEDGVFCDVDNSYTWVVEGERVTTGFGASSRPSLRRSKQKPGSSERWKPLSLPPPVTSSRSTRHVRMYKRHV